MSEETQDFNAFLANPHQDETPEGFNWPETIAEPEPANEEAEPVVESEENVEESALAYDEAQEEPPKRNKAAEKRIAKLIKEREHLRGQVSVLSQQRTPNDPAPSDIPYIDPSAPDPSKYTDEIQYRVDLTLYNRDLKARDDAFMAKQAEAMSRYDDVQDLIDDDNDRASRGEKTANATVVSLIKESPIAGDLWYHLLKHPDDAIRIAKLNPIQTAKAIGAIEASLTNSNAKPTVPVVAKKPLPTPIAPVRTGKAAPATKQNFGFTEY